MKKPNKLPDKPQKTVLTRNLIARLDELNSDTGYNGRTPLKDLISDLPLDQLFIESKVNWENVEVALVHIYEQTDGEFKNKLDTWKEKEKKFKNDMRKYLEYKKNEAEAKIHSINEKMGKI